MSLKRYERAKTVEEACRLLAAGEGTVAVLAGGTDILADLRGGRPVDAVVDIKAIPELREIRWSSNGELVIGSCVTMRRVAEDPRIAERYPALAIAAGRMASFQVRSRATIAGNLGNASPCADTAPALLVLQARVRLAGPRGRIEAAFHGFIRDCKKTALERGEIITAVVVPPGPPGLRSAFLKIKRVRGHDMALVNAAGAFDPATREFRLAIGSVAPTPLLIPGLEGVCPPGATADEVGEAVAEIALEHIHPIDDVRATAEYRRDMTALLCRRLAKSLMTE